MTFPAQFNLSTLDGSNGFVLNGIDAGDRSGRSVSGAGDINGDGIDDLIIGADSADPNGSSSGESYVVFGSTQGFGTSLNLSTLDGSNGFILNGIDAGDSSGYSVSGAGDINGDGFDDLIIGADDADPNGSRSGESYVVFGSTQGFGTSLNLSTLDGSNGFVLNGIDAYDFSGRSVSGAGDINGDGFDDLIIGAFAADPNGSSSGESYVVFGSTQGFGTSLNLSTLDGSNGFILNGVDANDVSGRSVSGAGDINGDGIDDLIIGADSADPNSNDSGESYVVFGSTQGFGTSLNLSTLDGSNGFILNGIDAYDVSSRSVSGAGDINGDGIDDLIIGAPYADPNGNSAAGESYVVFGSDQGFAASLDLSTLDGDNGFILNGIDASDRSGRSVSGAGDINGDGIDDLIIGADSAGPNGNRSGESYVVFGSNQGFGTSLDLSTLDGSNGFVLNGIAADDYSGRSVSGAGDINGDGIDDLIIGAYGADPNGNRSGESYVVFGRLPLPQVSIAATDADAAEAGTDPGTFTITRTGDTTNALTVVYTVAMTATATNGGDYDLLTGTVEIAAGQASATVTVTPIDDNRVEGAETVTVELTDTADYELDSNASSATVTIADDDTAGFSLSQTTATVNEVNGTDRFTITLDAEPLSPVEFAISSDDTSEVDVSPPTVTLDSSNWDTGVEVTLNGQNDTDLDGDTTSTITVSVVDANSDDAFDGLADQTVTVTTTDNDIRHTGSVDPTAITEGDSSNQLVTFTITRTGVLTAASSVRYELIGSATPNVDFGNIGGTGGATTQTGTLSFVANEASKTITVEVFGDAVDEDAEDIRLRLTSPTADPDFEANVDTDLATVTITDNDTVGLTLSKTTATVSEAATTDSFTVVLDSQPTSNVVVLVESGDTAEATVAPTPLTFTPDNWDDAQTVTITGVDDALADGDQDTSITIRVDATASDAAFDGLSETLTVTTTDNDVPGFTLDPTSLTLSEAGGTATFTVVLNTQPTAEVTLPLSVSDPMAAELDQAQLTFSTTNWDTPQTVTVTGLDNDISTGDQSLTITTENPTSTDANYNGAGANPVDVDVTVTDDDVPGFTLDPTSLTLSEAGGTATFTVVLNTQPTAEVILPLSVSDPMGAELDQAQLTFSTTNWNTPQTVTITGLDDAAVDGDQTITLTTNDPTSTDANYNGAAANPDDVSVTVTDDDVAGFALDATAVSVSESGATDSFTVVLTRQPLSDVVLQVESQDTTVATVQPLDLTFTPEDWDQPQTVTVTGTDDARVDGDQTSQISVRVVAAQSDDAFDGLNAQRVSVTTTDDDVPPAPPSVDAAPPTGTNPPTFSGTGEPGTTVEVLNGTTVLGTATVDGNGNWSFTPEDSLAAGEYGITFRSLDADGNVSALSEPLVFTVDATSSPGGFTPSDDDFTGTEARDLVFALAGNDIVRGLGGGDRLAGEAGNDQLFGGDDNDRLIGGDGNDTAVGGTGNDWMLGGAGRDRLVGGSGNDRLIGGDGGDTLFGSSGDDTLIGGTGNDRLSGQGGNDLMRGNLGVDVLNGGAGNDRQFGGAGNDRLNGQGGDDVLRGGADRDVLRGGAGNDRLAGELGNDLIVTGAGRDRIVIRSGQGFDRVTDFTDGQDRIVLGGINFGQLSIQQRNNDVLISQGNERLLLLQNTNVGDISAADFA